MITDEELIFIIIDILGHIKKYDHDKNFSNWFAGITYNPWKSKITNDSNSFADSFKSWDLRNKETARSLKKYLNEKGFKKSRPEYTLKKTFQRVISDSSYLYIYKNK